MAAVRAHSKAQAVPVCCIVLQSIELEQSVIKVLKGTEGLNFKQPMKLFNIKGDGGIKF